MRLRSRLILAIAFASLVPLGFLGLGAAGVAYKQVLGKESELLDGTGQGMSLFVETWLKAQQAQLNQQVGLLEIDTLPEESRETWLRLVYRQLPEARILTLYDLDTAELVASYPTRGEDHESIGVREPIDAARHEQLGQMLPIDQAVQAWMERPDPSMALAPLFGEPYQPEGRSAPVIPAVVLLPEQSRTFILGVEFALDEVQRSFEKKGESGPAVALMDSSGSFILGSDRSLIDPSAIGPFLENRVELRYSSSQDGRDVLAATNPVLGPGWTVVVASPVSISAQTAVKIRDVTAYLAAVAGILCLLVGAHLARQLSGPVVQLKDAALAVAQGDLGREVEVSGSDEIAELTQAFNHMSRQLQEDSRRILEQQSEIEAFNIELQDRVDQRTRELEEAHQQLLHSARMAAVGEMGAGLAHELNNPIAGILGMTQILMAKAREEKSPMLEAIEEQALRCKHIVGTLLGFSSELSSEQIRSESQEPEPVDLSKLVAEVLVLVSAPLAQRGVQVHTALQPGLEILGHRAELGQAISQLCTSMCAIAPRGGNLHIGGSQDNETVEIAFRLEGPEIRFGTDDWKASGLGFWAARRVLDAHHGTLDRVQDEPVESAGGLEARWRIRFEVS